MSIITLPNGTGSTVRSVLGGSGPLEVNGNVWYVHYGTGTDAASPAGRNRQAPLKTLYQAVSNSSSGDIIVLMHTHEESLASGSYTISKKLTIVGEGRSAGLPTAKITNNNAVGSPLYLAPTAGYVQLKNIWFTAAAQANNRPVVEAHGANASFIIDGCYFQGGQYDDVATLWLDTAETIIIKNTTFISTATSIATQPYSAIGYPSADPIAALVMSGVVIDGGTHGWSHPYALDLSTKSLSYLFMENVSLLRGSDIMVPQAALGYINVRTSTRDCRIDWDGVT